MSIKCFYSEPDTGSRLEINEGKISLENYFHAIQYFETIGSLTLSLDIET